MLHVPFMLDFQIQAYPLVGNGGEKNVKFELEEK